MEPQAECGDDYLIIYNDIPKAENIQKRLCGQKIPDPFESPGPTVHLTFRSDGTRAFRGFKLKFEIVNASIPAYSCPNGERFLSGSEGMFASPDYDPPRLYNASTACKYSISVPKGKVVKVEFLALDLEPSNQCLYDYVTFYDGATAAYPKLGKLCGKQQLPVMTASGNKVYVIFRTDPFEHRTGFLAKFTAEDPPTDPGPCGEPAAVIPGEDRIVGGALAAAHAWPWVVSIRASSYGFKHWCGGSIIADRWILTAAHCTYNFDPKESGALEPSDLRVIVGKFDQESQEEWQREIRVEAIIRHENYVVESNPDDVALLRLKHPITPSLAAKSICLPSTPVPYDNTDCFIVGWGSTAYGNGPERYMRQANIPLIDNELCSSETFYGDRVTPDMICAGLQQGGRDSCSGDSGGPLVCRVEPNKYVQFGIINWGVGCGDAFKPGVLANVYNYMDWINDKMSLS